jgi:hypothetical protein
LYLLTYAKGDLPVLGKGAATLLAMAATTAATIGKIPNSSTSLISILDA